MDRVAVILLGSGSILLRIALRQQSMSLPLWNGHMGGAGAGDGKNLRRGRHCVTVICYC